MRSVISKPSSWANLINFLIEVLCGPGIKNDLQSLLIEENISATVLASCSRVFPSSGILIFLSSLGLVNNGISSSMYLSTVRVEDPVSLANAALDGQHCPFSSAYSHIHVNTACSTPFFPFNMF